MPKPGTQRWVQRSELPRNHPKIPRHGLLLALPAALRRRHDTELCFTSSINSSLVAAHRTCSAPLFGNAIGQGAEALEGPVVTQSLQEQVQYRALVGVDPGKVLLVRHVIAGSALHTAQSGFEFAESGGSVALAIRP